MHFQGGVCREEGVINKWRHKHRVFLKQHDIRLKTVTLKKYVHYNKNIEFATFFVRNAELETMRLKFLSPQTTSLKDFMNIKKRCFNGATRLLGVLDLYCQGIVGI